MLTGDSFFHLTALGAERAAARAEPVRRGRVVCLIDPVGDVYACPFVIHDEFLAGSVRDAGGFTKVWRESDLFAELREPQRPGACSCCGSYDACQGGCMAAKFFVGLPLDGPDPECVRPRGGRDARCLCRTAPADDGPLQAGPRRSPAQVPVTLGRR